jgi:hypothetical protein
MTLVNSISFSHRFSDNKLGRDTCAYQEINHTYSGDTATAITRAYFQFMMACGYAQQSVIEAMFSIATEYEEAYLPEKTRMDVSDD